MLNGLAARLRALFRRARFEREIDEELTLHVERTTERLRGQGLTPEEARAQARREFGDLTRIKEESRDAFGLRWIEEGAHDVRYGLRTLSKNPLGTAIIVLTLALGVGANTAVFSILNAMFFRPPPGTDPSRLVWVVGQQQGEDRSLSFPEYRAYREAASSLSGVALYWDTTVAVGGPTPVRTSAFVVSGNYFDVLGLQLAAGRGFRPEEASTLDASPVVVIGWRLAERLFNDPAAAIGRSLMVNGQPFVVIGVAPRDFGGIALDRDVPGDELWLPITMLRQLESASRDVLKDPRLFVFRAFGRLASGATVEGASAEVQGIAKAFAENLPSRPPTFSAAVSAIRGLQRPGRRDDVVQTSTLMMAVPALILLICVANVANLLIGRAAARRREIAMRLALGASRFRLVRQLLTESVLLAFAGGIAGLVVAHWINNTTLAAIAAETEFRAAAQLDWLVGGLTATVVVATGILCGLVPALGASRSDLVTSLKSGNGWPSRRHSFATRVFVVAQITASVVLLVVTGLVLRSMAKAARVDVGFETRSGVTMSFEVGVLGYSRERIDRFYRDVLDRVRAAPGVRAASFTDNLPMLGPDNTVELAPIERPADAPQTTTGVAFVSPEYFRTLDVAVLAGRDFAFDDDGSRERAVIVNETLARKLWPGGDVLGQRVNIPYLARRNESRPTYQVIGVVRDHRYRHVAEKQYPVVYLAQRQYDRAIGRQRLVVRTAGDEEPVLTALRAILHDMEPNLPLFDVYTMRGLIALDLRDYRMTLTLVGTCGVLAVFLTSLGVYGAMASSVVQRRREIGMRIALGADRRGVLRLILHDALKLAGVGAAIGILAAAGLTQTIRAFLYGVTPTDVTTFAAVVVLLAAVALLAAWAPARRAALLDPLVTLKME